MIEIIHHNADKTTVSDKYEKQAVLGMVYVYEDKHYRCVREIATCRGCIFDTEGVDSSYERNERNRGCQKMPDCLTVEAIFIPDTEQGRAQYVMGKMAYEADKDKERA